VTIRKKIKPAPIKTIEIEIAIAALFDVRKHIIVPNVSWGAFIHEMDIALINKTGFLKEVEIKISKSDFMKDLQKKHHHIDKHHRISQFYYAMPKYLYENIKELIPKDAGIITCDKNEYGVHATILKQAKKIKDCRKLTIEEQLNIARLGTMRIFSLKKQIIY
jgi:hypothetical protein